MKVHMMFKDSDFNYDQKPCPDYKTLSQDLELEILIETMAKGDRLIFEIAQKVLFNSLEDAEQIRYRQHVIEDSIKNKDTVRKIYKIASDALEMKKKHYWSTSTNRLSYLLSGSVNLLQMFRERMTRLREIADESGHLFSSEAFSSFFSMLKDELNDDYLASLKAQLQELMFKDGVLISSELGKSNYGINYVLRKFPSHVIRWLKWRFAPRYCIHERDDSGAADLSKRKDRAVNNTANILAQSADHVLGFFQMLMTELAFYVGCINLHDSLNERKMPTAFAVVEGPEARSHTFKGLYDVSLALTKEGEIIGNELEAEDKELFVITGANQGGKSTFLRSIGQAQLMMQCGMFVPAESFKANMTDGVFTHFKREEDATMKSGKLDEELSRMNEIVGKLRKGSMVLFNESFAATNEREGSEIARQVVKALIEKGVKVFFVSHLYDFSSSLYGMNIEKAMFLRPERHDDENRTFKVILGEPLPTSFGEDIYKRVFEL